MALDLVHERQQAHAYLDRLRPEQLSAVRGLLETMLDPVSQTVTASVEDEEIGAEEESAVAQAREWSKHNKPIPHEEVLADFGLTMDDFERMGRTPLPPEQSGADR
jgi:hypothetical protein